MNFGRQICNTWSWITNPWSSFRCLIFWHYSLSGLLNFPPEDTWMHHTIRAILPALQHSDNAQKFKGGSRVVLREFGALMFQHKARLPWSVSKHLEHVALQTSTLLSHLCLLSPNWNNHSEHLQYLEFQVTPSWLLQCNHINWNQLPGRHEKQIKIRTNQSKWD